eukprot:CAMPEP_0114246440 /NCGR_PEP_ID=MMETSP0058-20121206/12462_1 /TAXON_ID=36894 /ORGANISM="Pyramimonas parkeae, CCMP726" /LENGTH=123 /DNA_ID=CAMNT_0001359623 /DNA_START=225 /DNA_END=596 /DNA_ORIENTATION=-
MSTLSSTMGMAQGEDHGVQRPTALSEYRRLQNLQSRTAAEAAKHRQEDPVYDLAMPKIQQPHNDLRTMHPPHQVHHHHFGWGGAQTEHVLGADDSTVSHHKRGQALNYCQDIHSKSALVSTRR